jgi:uroporphyrinogen-III synthase
VLVVDHATEAMQREARASGDQVKVVPGVSTDQVLPPAGPLAGCRVLVTRPQPAASTQRDAFVQRGADAVALPCLQPEPPEDLAAFDQAVANARSHDGLIVSSPIGVQALFDSLARTGLDARLLADRAIAVVGKATATALTHRGLRPDIVATTQRSEGIVSAIEDAGRLAQRWLHVRARDGRDTVRAAISSAGGTFTLAVAYRTTCPEPPPGVLSWLGHGVDAVCLHSGRTAEHLLALAQTHGFVHVLKEAAVFSAGPITTKALQEQGFEVRATAASPGDAGMLDVVCEGFRATS